MKEKQLQIYIQTRPLVKAEKQPTFDRYFKYAVKNNKFDEFQKIAYAIRLMSKGINITAFKPMFADKPRALNFAGELVEIACKNQEHVL